MKLSDAIRLGAMMGPQIFGHYYDTGGASCALGAAAQASQVSTFVLDDYWPWLQDDCACPGCGMTYAGGGATIVCLNDTHRWTRERIADWVQTIEPAEVSASETNGECSLGKGPIGPSLEEINAVTITK